MLKLRENGLTIDYMYETNSVLRKTAETEISDLTFWLRFGSVRVFINRNRTEIRFPHIPNGEEWCVTYVPLGASYKASSHNYTPSTMLCVQLTTIFLTNNRLPLNLVNVSR